MARFGMAPCRVQKNAHGLGSGGKAKGHSKTIIFRAFPSISSHPIPPFLLSRFPFRLFAAKRPSISLGDGLLCTAMSSTMPRGSSRPASDAERLLRLTKCRWIRVAARSLRLTSSPSPSRPEVHLTDSIRSLFILADVWVCVC